MIILSFWLFILAVLYIPLLLVHRGRGRVHDTIRGYLDHGQEPPAALIDTLRGREDAISYSPVTASGAENLGVLILCLGGAVIGFGVILGLALWFSGIDAGSLAGPIIAAAGFVVAMIGLGLFLVGRLRRAKAGERG